jgi:hypothetical protein
VKPLCSCEAQQDLFPSLSYSRPLATTLVLSVQHEAALRQRGKRILHARLPCTPCSQGHLLKIDIDSQLNQTSGLPAAEASLLNVISDSCSKNKNNTVIAFYGHVLIWKWYTVIRMLFGPVGHTHTGVDQEHGTHNHLGDTRSFGTLAVTIVVFSRSDTGRGRTCARRSKVNGLSPAPSVLRQS